MLLILNKYHTNKFFVKNKAIYIISFIFILYLIITVGLRLVFSVAYDGITFGKLDRIPITFIKQYLIGFPLVCVFLE